MYNMYCPYIPPHNCTSVVVDGHAIINNNIKRNRLVPPLPPLLNDDFYSDVKYIYYIII